MMRLRRRAARIAVGLLLVLSAAGSLVGLRLRRIARLGAGVAAKQMCSCVYVDGRDTASCRSDLPPGVDRVHVMVDPAAHRVRAWVPILADRTAHYGDGWGCALQ